jgi:hypothetical protein
MKGLFKVGWKLRMKTRIYNYRNRPGEHCASTALRNLLWHYCDLDLPEAVVFGLGSGLDFLLLENETETAHVADRLDAEPQPCTYEALRLSRNPPAFLSTYNLWGKFHDTRVGRSLPEAYELAIALNAQRMLEGEAGLSLPGMRASRGIAGLRRFAEHLPAWFQRDDFEELATYAASCIEKFGTGGGNFRTLYAGFLRQARATVPHLVDEEAPQLAARSSAKWTELSSRLRELGREHSEADAAPCQRMVGEILALETQLFERLAATRFES